MTVPIANADSAQSVNLTDLIATFRPGTAAPISQRIFDIRGSIALGNWTVVATAVAAGEMNIDSDMLVLSNTDNAGVDRNVSLGRVQVKDIVYIGSSVYRVNSNAGTVSTHIIGVTKLRGPNANGNVTVTFNRPTDFAQLDIETLTNAIAAAEVSDTDLLSLYDTDRFMFRRLTVAILKAALQPAIDARVAASSLGPPLYVPGTIEAGTFSSRIRLSDFAPVMPDPIPNNMLLSFTMPAFWNSVGGDEFVIEIGSNVAYSVVHEDGGNAYDREFIAGRYYLFFRPGNRSRLQLLTEYVSEGSVSLTKLASGVPHQFISYASSGLAQLVDLFGSIRAGSGISIARDVAGQVTISLSGGGVPTPGTHTRYAAASMNNVFTEPEWLAGNQSTGERIVYPAQSDPHYRGFAIPATETSLMLIEQEGSGLNSRGSYRPALNEDDVLQDIGGVSHKTYISTFIFNASAQRVFMLR